MIGSPLLTAALLGASYISSLVLLFRWFARSDTSRVLPLEQNGPDKQHCSRCQPHIVMRLLCVIGSAAGLLACEAGAFAVVGSYLVPGFSCPDGWLPTSECILDTNSGKPGRETALEILLGCAAILLAARRLACRGPFYALAFLVTSIISFGAACDLVAGVESPARPYFAFKLIAALQLTAALGFILGNLILRMHAIAAFLRCTLAHMAGACVRILGALAMLAVWPNLPPASVIALILTLLLVPGVATALTGAAALSTFQPLKTE